MTKRTEIEIELSETIAYSRTGERFESFCTVCEAPVEMAATQAAAILTRTTEREIFRLVESGKVHFVETGRVFICLRSLHERLSAWPERSKTAA